MGDNRGIYSCSIIDLQAVGCATKFLMKHEKNSSHMSWNAQIQLFL